ncbi:MAG TPA: response regulator transcription factor [Burkholderiaceae bacterium]|nr:response regulator transcription factor [Burkholderiaceae bacterium]
MAERKRVLLADDHQLVRAGLRVLIDALPDFAVVAEVGDGIDAVEQARRLQPELALLDISMPRMSGLEAATAMRIASPGTRVIVLSMHASEQHFAAALKAGATGYVIKDAAVNELAEALRAVAAGDHYVSPRISGAVMQSLARNLRGEEVGAAGAALSPRQRQVLQLIAEGRNTREIAEQLHVSVKTVETHRAELMRRLDIHDVAGLTRYAIRAGLVSPDR